MTTTNENLSAFRIAVCALLILFYYPTIDAQQLDPAEIVNQSAFQSADLGILVKNLTDDSEMMNWDANKKLAPASVLKVYTAARAWAVFGPTHRFKTTVSIDGDVDQGTLYGHVVVKGFGDPTLDAPLEGAVTLTQIADDILTYCRTNQIQCIEGVIADPSYFTLPGIPEGYIQQDVANYYGAGCYGLNVRDNLFPITFHRQGGGRASIASFDTMACSFVTSDVVAEGTSDQAYAYFHPESNGIHVVGKIPTGSGSFSIKAAIKNPPGYIADQLTDLLKAGGLLVQENSEVQWSGYTSTSKTLWSKTYDSPTLADILIPVLHKSNNLYAETLHRHLQTNPVDGEQMKSIVDGSGLSPTNRISANQLMSSLEQIFRTSDFEDFLSRFPRNGMDGTVASVLRDVPGRLFIKSGYIGGVRSYMGLRQSTSGDWIAFVCLANGLECSPTTSRLAWERLLRKISEM